MLIKMAMNDFIHSSEKDFIWNILVVINVIKYE